MARNRRSRRRRAQGRARGGLFTMKFPLVLWVEEGHTIAISFASLFGGAPPKQFNGVPWRFRSVTLQAANAGSSEPSVMQARCNSSQTTNVEAVRSIRWVSTPGVAQRRSLRWPAPNLWKEDEDRAQIAFNLDNIKIGATEHAKCCVLANFVIEFGAIPFNAPVNLTVIRSSQIPGPSSSVPFQNHTNTEFDGPDSLDFQNLSISSHG